MGEFWLASIGLLLISSLFIVIPLIKKAQSRDDILRDDLNKALYKDRLSELDVESQSGIVDDQKALVVDLKQSLLDDVPRQSKPESQQLNNTVTIVLSLLLMVGLSYGAYSQFGAMGDVKRWQSVADELPNLSKKLMQPNGVQLTENELNDLTLALRTQLHKKPNDATGWLLLGRLAMSNRDTQMAMAAMEKAYKLDPTSTGVKLSYAQSLMMSQDLANSEKARALLQSLLNEEDVDIRVLSLLSFDAFERQDFAKAIEYWEMMQTMIGPNDERYGMLTRSIESAKARMSEDRIENIPVEITVNLGVDVTVEVNSVLIVSVHSGDGSPIPVAAARYQLGPFPTTVTLDDNNVMIQGRHIAELENVIVKARIDRDGNVSSREGDWYGQSEVTPLGQSVSVTIQSQY
ncbi:c-type cytochrome biogenesis protein CcmI [Vibrio sp.]|nr:c-type cytochrome biogenesis protein CcmI [Vibrio sp.]